MTSKTSIRDPENWRRRLHGEPSLHDLMNDPLTHLVMQRDGVNRQALSDVIYQAQIDLWKRQVCACRKAA